VGDLGLACEIGAAAVGIDAAALREAAESAAVRSRLQASTAAFAAHQINQRPGFVLEDAIGDKAVFSGLVRVAPLATTIDAMLDDCAAYAAHAAHFGPPPAA
jgi:predicted DsbA family dithiol-disulfide isomerase